ncbi:MAG: glycosyltransferase family 2 protein [Desulfobacterales bacterium]|nr:glycosyltransferase family 2 protein [Desulfobacterales bacterium]
MKKISIVIPVYNEEKESLSNTISQLFRISWPGNMEIIVVDDGSDEKVKDLEISSMDRIKIIRHKRNRGYGAALKTGISNSCNECIVITDADGTYPNERIPELVAIFEKGNFDMVVGARVGRNVKIPLIRKPAKWFITKLASYLTDTKIPDINSGLRVMKKNVVEKYLNILPDGFSFTSTITLAMLTNSYRVKYVPIDYFERKGKSKIRPFHDTLNFIQLIIRTVMYFNPLKIFVPLSLSLVLLAFLVLAGSWIFMDKAMDVTFGVILMSSVMVLAIGMLADLIDKRLK